MRESIAGSERENRSGESRAAMTEKPVVPISRRQFARHAAIASAVASIASAAALGGDLASGAVQTLPAGSQASSPPAQPQLPPGVPNLAPESQAEADARFQLILAQYGSRFSDEQKADLRRLCNGAQPALDHLRAYKVENSDGPGLYLKPLFEREKKPKPAAHLGAAKTSGAVVKP
jgi:hypothetical protein